MLKRNIILLFALAVFAGSVCAQVRPGIKLGYNLSGVMADYTGKPEEFKNTTTGYPDNFKMKSGFQFGMIADCPINDVLAIQPGARFAMQGFVDKYSTSATGSSSGKKNTRKFSLYYLQIPVYAQYRRNVYEETNILFQAGPYAGFGLFGRQSWTSNGKQQELTDAQKKKTFGNGTAQDIQKTFDFGVGVGAGIEFYRFQLMLNYDFGLSKAPFQMDSSRTKSGSYHVDMRNHNFSVTLGIIFGRRDPLQNQKD